MIVQDDRGAEVGLLTGCVALLAALPAVVSNPYWLGVLIVSMYFGLLAVAWNLLAGYAGQFSMAPACFAMLGAYTTGLLAQYWNGSVWMGTLAAILVPALIGMGLGRIVMRLRGPYLALTTLSFAEISRLIIANSYNVTRGDLGLAVPEMFSSRLAYYYLFLGALLASLVGVALLLRSPAGLFLLAIRDDEVAARSRGVKVVFWKTAAFTLSSGLSGMAGALYAHFSQLVSPELGFIAQTGLVISMVVIGGIGSLTGPILGAFLVYLGSEALRRVGGVQLIVFALLVILFARFFRGGLWGLARSAVRRRAAP